MNDTDRAIGEALDSLRRVLNSPANGMTLAVATRLGGRVSLALSILEGQGDIDNTITIHSPTTKKKEEAQP